MAFNEEILVSQVFFKSLDLDLNNYRLSASVNMFISVHPKFLCNEGLCF